jgi:hypothetical protein
MAPAADECNDDARGEGNNQSGMNIQFPFRKPIMLWDMDSFHDLYEKAPRRITGFNIEGVMEEDFRNLAKRL